MATDPSSPSSPSSRQDPPSQADPSSASASSGPEAPSDPPSPADPGAGGSEADADRLAAASPTTPAAELARIAASRPDLHPALAVNPATYPDLVDWLRTSPDPAVQAALARRTTPPAQPEPAQAEPAQAAQAQAQAEAPARAADAPTNQPPAGAPAPTTGTKRRTGLPRPAVIAVVVLVTVLVLSGAAWAGIRFLSPKDHSRRASRPATATVSAPEPSESPSPDLPEGGLVTPDPSWADGAHEVWSLDKEEGKGSLMIAGDQLFIITNKADFTVDSVAAYSISGSEPEKQWEAQLPDNRGIPIEVWGDYIVVDDQLIERSSGRVMEAPWSARVMLVIVINDTAIACYEKDACEAWRSSDPFSRAWSATIKDSQRRLGSSRLITRANIYVGDRTILSLSPKMLVDVDTGETFDLSAEGYMSLASTTDGWIASDASGEGKHTILSPTGEKKGTFSGNNDRDERFGPTLSQERPSSEQYRRYVENGDVSWAELRMSMDRNKVPGDMCPIDITIGNNTISDFYRPVDSANCSRYPDALAVSDDKKVVIAVSDVPLTRHSGIILAAWSFTGEQEIDFPGLDTKKSLLHLAGPSLIIASDGVNGKIRAYAPGNS